MSETLRTRCLLPALLAMLLLGSACVGTDNLGSDAGDAGSDTASAVDTAPEPDTPPEPDTEPADTSMAEETCVKQGFETCNDIDDDCDGVTDEGCQCDYKGKSEGVCGENAYVSSSSGECYPPPDYEEDESSCDGKDNDCNGEVDDARCSCNYKKKEQGVCKDAEIDPESGDCKMPEAYEEKEVSCDGKDNDCDGQLDDECNCVHGRTKPCYEGDKSKAGTGICKAGRKTCEKGMWGKCMGAKGPATEACDGLDNDCDGKADEGVDVSEDFEGAPMGWKKHTNARKSFSVNPAATDAAHGGKQAGKARDSCNGTCGYGGLAKRFSFGAPARTMTMWLKAKADSYGRVNVILKDSSGYHVLWEKKAGGNRFNMGWTKKTFDVSKYDASFTLIVGNADQSMPWCRRACDHEWTIWVDDISITRECPMNQP